jgi:hypothetical protein
MKLEIVLVLAVIVISIIVLSDENCWEDGKAFVPTKGIHWCHTKELNGR